MNRDKLRPWLVWFVWYLPWVAKLFGLSYRETPVSTKLLQTVWVGKDKVIAFDYRDNT